MLKGELLSHDGDVCVRVDGPTAGGQALVSDLAQPANMKWGGAGATLPLTTKGDLLGRDASVLVRIPIGTDGKVLTADSSQSAGLAWAAAGGGGGGGNIPLTSLYHFDDWAVGWAGSGALNWVYSGTLTEQPQPESSHPGIARLYNEYINASNKFQYIFTQEQTVTGGTPPPPHVLHGGSLLPADNFDVRWLIRLSSIAAHVRCRLGLKVMPNLMTVAGAFANGIYVEKDFSDSNWFGVCSKSADPLVDDAVTRADLGVAVGTGWTWLRMRRKDATTVAFSVNGGTETDISTNVPVFALCPFALVWTDTGGPATVYLDLDFFDMTVSFTSR